MMKNLLATVGLIGAVLTLALPPAQAHDYEAGPLRIDHPWARAPIGTVANTAAYMKISNVGDATDRLVGVKSDVAKHVMLHESRMEGDIMRMVHLEDGVAIPAHGTAELKPLGLHVMLTGLKRPLKDGDRFPMTLVFANQGEVNVEIAVEKSSGASGKDHGKHDH